MRGFLTVQAVTTGLQERKMHEEGDGLGQIGSS